MRNSKLEKLESLVLCSLLSSRFPIDKDFTFWCSWDKGMPAISLIEPSDSLGKMVIQGFVYDWESTLNRAILSVIPFEFYESSICK
ncbi:hypothetical protein [Nostoc sp.]|uniref:hypothetical protein n=1 Tax=Nostoc sp. TaxID=1180 RepID=UPI002FEF6B1F